MEEIQNLDYEEYYILKDNIIYKISIEKTNSEIYLSHKNYKISLNNKDLSFITNIDFSSIEQVYQFIVDKFEDNKIEIKNIIKYKELNLIIQNDDKKIEITLLFNKSNENYLSRIKKEIIQLKEENKKLKVENDKLIEEVKKLKKYHEKNNPNNIKFLKNIVTDSYYHCGLVNAFIVFNSINNILYLIYAKKDKSFISYDLTNNKKIKEIKNYHNEYITNFRHYHDSINNRDLIISISSNDNNIRLWNVKDWVCLTNITNINKSGIICSACFLNEKNKDYILTSNFNKQGNPEKIKIFDFIGNKLGEIENSNDSTLIIKIYYDEISSKNYIVTGNINYIKSYDCNNNKIYQKYYEHVGNISRDKNKYMHFDIVIKDIKGLIKLMESCGDGNLRIWNFHSGIMINKIKISDDYIGGLCLWNDNYLFIGTRGKILLYELTNKIIAKTLEGYCDKYFYIKKILHPNFGESLISQNSLESSIKIWINN